jgi:hypothetical protein
MLKYRIKCTSGCINDKTYSDSSSRIQKLRENTLNSNIVKTKTLSVLPDKNATTHTVNRVRRAGSSAPKKASLVL